MEKTIEIPPEVEISLEKGILIVKGKLGEIKKQLKHPRIKLEIKDKEVKISSKTDRRQLAAILGTWSALIQNMIIGVIKGWEARLKIIYAHFPVKISVEGDKILIHNFMGERLPRVAKIFGECKVDVQKDELRVSGISKEDVGQTCGNIELVTKISGLDRRVFQDGIYISSKPKPAADSNEKKE